MNLIEHIAYLGPEGSFTHQAAEQRFGSKYKYVAQTTIQSVFKAVETNKANYGVVPIENNQEGIVFETIDTISDSTVRIAAELVIPIHFSLASLGEKIANIQKIYSKDIAFRQCKNFLNKHFEGQKVELIPVESTSKAAKLAHESPSSAAICSKSAANIFHVPILFENIQDSKVNLTRFFILAKEPQNQKTGSDKTTIIVSFPDSDKPGTLSKFLQDFEKYGVNITKLVSHPSREGANFGFWFLMEFEGHVQDPTIKLILQHHAAEIKCLGSYKQFR